MHAAKSELRKVAIARRGAIAPGQRELYSQRLARDGLRLVRAAAIQYPTISAYWPIRDEFDTRPLIAALAEAGFATALPVTGARGSALVFRLWKPGDSQNPGQMGIPEPAAHLPEVLPNFLFVPLAAFDRHGHRIGYGAGHYDCTLAALRRHNPILATGVAYECQEIDKVPHEPHDAELDFVLTERRLVVCGTGR